MASPVTPLRPAQLGGSQAVVCDVAAGLTRRGHDVRLYCTEGSEVPGVRLSTVPAPEDAELALVMPAAGSPAPAPAPGVARAIEAMYAAIVSWAPDVISQHAFDAPALEGSHGTPVLHTLHLPPVVPAVTEAASRIPPDRLATVSLSNLAAWRDAGVAVGHVLRNGVEGLDLPLDPPERVALIAGRISPEKGIEDGLRAARSAGLPVRVAGAPYDPAYRVDLDGAADLGQLTRRRLRAVMAGSAVTVCAVRWDEPFGMVAAEAQMAGCPVAAYGRGAMPEVIEDGVSGVLAKPGDVKALARAIEACLLLDRARVRASARRRLNLDGAVEGYEKTLAKVAS